MSLEEPPLVLYVDDEQLNLRVFEANFRSRFRLALASSGADALEILGARSAEIGVIVCDERMPRMSGVELLEEVAAAYPEVMRMLITEYADLDSIMGAVNRGQVMRFIVKPWSKSDLSAALDDALRIHALVAEKRAIQSQLLRNERLATLGQVSAGLAHELMNPVSYICQNVETLRREMTALQAYVRPQLEERPDAAVSTTLADLPALLDDIEAGARQIREIAAGVKKQAKGDEDAVDADLETVVSFAVRMARAEIGKRARIQVRGEPVRVVGAPARLTQVLLNLLINAGQAMEGRERLGLVEVEWVSRPGGVELAVRDNGCGIPPESLERVFEPLFTTKEAGTGLGLPISREIVRAYGGELLLESKVGEGTTFTLKLKAAPPRR